MVGSEHGETSARGDAGRAASCRPVVRRAHHPELNRGAGEPASGNLLLRRRLSQSLSAGGGAIRGAEPGADAADALRLGVPMVERAGTRDGRGRRAGEGEAVAGGCGGVEGVSAPAGGRAGAGDLASARADGPSVGERDVCGEDGASGGTGSSPAEPRPQEAAARIDAYGVRGIGQAVEP